AGQHHIDLDLAQVNYISSAGIRVLVKYFKQLNSVCGALRVVRATDAVLQTLQLCGFAAMPVSAPSERARESESQKPPEAQHETQRWERNGVTFESHELSNGSALDCRLRGSPEKFSAGLLSATDSVRVRFDADAFGVGLGAFGSGP